MTAQRLLLERGGMLAVSYLSKMAKSGKSPEARVHALRTLDGLSALPDEVIARGLTDGDANVRENAIQLAEPRLADPRMTARISGMADDPNPRVRFQCALALGNSRDQKVILPLLKIVDRDMESSWTRAAVLSSIGGQEQQFMREVLAPIILAASMDRPNRPGSSPQAAIAKKHPEAFPALMGELVGCLPPSVPWLPEELFASSNPADLPWQMAALGGFGSSLPAKIKASPTELRTRARTLFARAGELALDTAQPMSVRLAAIGLLGRAEGEASGVTLQKLIEPQQPAEIQTAAIRAIGQSSASGLGAALVKGARWNAYTPAVRDTALSVLTANTDLLAVLFSAIESGDVPAWTVNADRRNQLMKHKDDALRKRAEKLFKDLTPGDRMKIYEQSKSVLKLQGDGKNGHVLFQKNCAPCHTFAGEGHLVGPDLTGIRNQPAEVILLHIIVPEYEIMPIFTCYNVETKGGDAYTGLLAAETPGNITLRMAQGIEQKIPRSDIAKMTTSRLSLMPQEIEKGMTKQELADMLAFLKGQ